MSVKRFLLPVVILAMTAGTLAVSVGVASAHHPDIEADIACLDGATVINYASTSWEGYGPNPTNDPSRANAQIDITINNVTVDSGSYTAPDYSFSGTVPLPAGAQPGDTLTISAVSIADWDGATRTVLVAVPDLDCDPLVNGRFTGGGHQIRVDGVRVTRGLTIHCDLLLSNNLEINWQGNQFHLTEHLTTVACTDDPDIIQAPPPAPLDTLIGVGTGRYNGSDGYTIEFTLVDHGEPGSSDQAAFLVYETASPGNVVLDIPLQVMTGGNLQAHYDQPHK